MRIRYRVAIVVALLICISAGAWLVLFPREPSYNGKPLSYWLDEYSRMNNRSFPAVGVNLSPSTILEINEQRTAISNAMVHMGANALPTLSRMLRARDSAFKLKVMEFAQKHDINIHFVSSIQRNLDAGNLLLLMGDQAVCAVPVLAEVYARDFAIVTNRPGQAGEAGLMLDIIPLILGRLGPAASNAVPALTLGLSVPDSDLRELALLALYDIRTGPDTPVLVLFKDLQDPDPGIRQRAMHLIQKLGARALTPLFALLQDPDIRVRDNALDTIKQLKLKADPAIAVPALTKALNDPHFSFALLALHAIKPYGPDAKSAVPAILDLLHRRESSSGSPNYVLRSEIKNVLDRIDPAAARAAGLE